MSRDAGWAGHDGTVRYGRPDVRGRRGLGHRTPLGHDRRGGRDVEANRRDRHGGAGPGVRRLRTFSAGRCGRAAPCGLGLGIDVGWLGVVPVARQARHVTGLLTVRVAGPRPWHEDLRKPDRGRHGLPIRTRRCRRQQRRLDGFRRQRIGQRHRPTGRTGRRTAPIAVSVGRTPRVGVTSRRGVRWTFRPRLRPGRWFRRGVRVGLRSQRSEPVRVRWMPVTRTTYMPVGTLRWVPFATRGRIPVMGVTCRRLAVPVGRCPPGYATGARPGHA